MWERLKVKSSPKKFCILDSKIDDKNYVECDPEDISGQKFFIFIDKCHVPNRVRFKLKQKFAKRYLIWQAMDESEHIWKPYIKLSTMNAEEYK